MPPKDEDFLRKQLWEANLDANKEFQRRLVEIEERERARDREWNFFRGKQFAYAALFGGIGAALMHWLLK